MKRWHLAFVALAILLVLTIFTVSVTSFDLGSQGNLVVAMVIGLMMRDGNQFLSLALPASRWR